MTPLRSVLYVPASNPRALDKARTLPCDAVIVDLEDAVAPEAKEEARARAVAALRAGFGEKRTLLRVNAPGTPWAEADLAAALDCAPHAVLLPKVQSAEDVLACHAGLAGAPEGVCIAAMIETPRALLNLASIAATGPSTRLRGFVLGLNDLAAATGARLVPGREPFRPALAMVVAAARAYGLAAIDAVFNDLEDQAGFEAECGQARDFGFDGKTLIHPRQIESANRAFAPSQTELAWAHAVTAAFADPANAGRGALKVQGAMVEHLHLEQAERLLALAGARA
ncbi:MAG: CoA ester lyase [Pseudomonadota bacterium]|nr:CoA ester lyase [Pseudomonadota bacterium]